MIDPSDLTPPEPTTSLVVRLRKAVRHVRKLVEAAAMGGRAPHEPSTPEVPEDQARLYGPLITEKARRVIEEWVRAERGMDSQLVDVAVMSLKHTIETAAEAQEPVEPAAPDAVT